MSIIKVVCCSHGFVVVVVERVAEASAESRIYHFEGNGQCAAFIRFFRKKDSLIVSSIHKFGFYLIVFFSFSFESLHLKVHIRYL